MIASFLLCCAHTPAPGGNGGGGTGQTIYLWTIENPEGTVKGWLLGSIHVSKADSTLDSAAQAAFEASDTLVLEIDLNAVDFTQVAGTVNKISRVDDEEHLPKLLGPEDFDRLKAVLQERELAVQQLGTLQPWMVTMMLTLTTPATSGDFAIGVDRYFAAQAEGEHHRHHPGLQRSQLLDCELPLLEHRF
ncbi:MAG: TraB/GumN family protein, partial [Myxococcota bacterium]